MIIEIGDNGLQSVYDWKSYDVDSDDPAQAAYLAGLQRYPFLASADHTWESKDYGPTPGNLKQLKELTKSSRYAIVINHAQKNNQQTGGYHLGYWFSYCYRVPGEEY